MQDAILVQTRRLVCLYCEFGGGLGGWRWGGGHELGGGALAVGQRPILHVSKLVDYLADCRQGLLAVVHGLACGVVQPSQQFADRSLLVLQAKLYVKQPSLWFFQVQKIKATRGTRPICFMCSCYETQHRRLLAHHHHH